MQRKLLSDIDVWNRLQHALEAISGEDAETALGAEILAFARLYLVLHQHKLLKETDGLTTPDSAKRPEITTVSIRMPKEAIDALRRLAADSFPPKFTDELVAFILGKYLAETGHFNPAAASESARKQITISLRDADFVRLERHHVESRTPLGLDAYAALIINRWVSSNPTPSDD